MCFAFNGLRVASGARAPGLLWRECDLSPHSPHFIFCRLSFPGPSVLPRLPWFLLIIL